MRGVGKRHEGRRLAHPLPEVLELFLRSFTPALGQAAGENDGVDRPGARAADRVKVKLTLFDQPVEDSPGESAERAAALQRERKVAGWPTWLRRDVGFDDVAGSLNQVHARNIRLMPDISVRHF